MNNYLKPKNKLIGFIILLFFITGCNRNEQKSEYIARVNDSYLTEDDLTAISGGYGGQKFFKEEIVRNWINRELLYQKAKQEGLLESEEFRRILNKSERELAAAMMLEKIYKENSPPVKPEEIIAFYEANEDIFRLHQTAYIINLAEFSDEDKAVMFRSAAVESEWNKAINFFSNDQSLKRSENNKLVYSSDLQPLKLNRILKELNDGEVSLIIPDDMQGYLIVKLVKKLESGTIPQFETIKEEVENRFVTLKKSEILSNYFEELYSENEIDVIK